MQAVDLAEMGVIYYKNAFIPNANGKLVHAIEAAKQTINIENEAILKANVENAPEDKDRDLIPINLTNILKYIPNYFWTEESILPNNFVPKTVTLEENNSFKIDSHDLIDDQLS